MKFISSRELRINPGKVWAQLRDEKDLVITSNGKPIGVLTCADESSLEEVLAVLRQGRAQAAAAEMRRVTVARGLDKLTDKSIREIIQRGRQSGRKAAAGGRR